MNAAIECVDLSKTYYQGLRRRPVRAVKHLNLVVQRGEVFGFLGPNGAGKTTTIRLILNLLRPSSGHCTVLGMDSQRDSVAIKRQIGNLPAELRLWEHMTAAQILRYMAQLRPGSDLNYAFALAEHFQLRLNKPVGQFSTGNKRKVGIIQAVMHRPALIILDEPTSGLDPLMRHRFAELLSEIRADGGTIFLSSHVLSEVRNVCDRVAILRAGALQTVDAIENLLRDRWVEIVTKDSIDRAQLSRIPGVEAAEAVSACVCKAR